jgi:hypothetical protein
MVAFVAPMTLVLGAGLFAAGLLSFVDIHFFKTKWVSPSLTSVGVLSGADGR